MSLWRSYFPHASDIVVGQVKGYPFRKETLTQAQLNHHVHIVGASGFGKSVLLSHIIRQTIEQGRGLLFIDLKADRETIEQVRGFAREANRSPDLKFFSLSDPSISSPYNLVANGSHTQIRDRIMTALNWSEEFYRNQSASFLLKVLLTLCWLRDHKGQGFTLANILECSAKAESITKLLEQIPQSEERLRALLELLYTWLKDKENYHSLAGLRSQLASILLSEFGDLVSTSEPVGIDLFEAVQKQQIVYVLLDSRRYSDTAKSIGRFILQDLKAVSSRVDAEIPRGDRKPLTVVIDEFADLATDDFVSFLDRARSSRFSVVVAHQELSDLSRVSDTFAARLIGNTSTLYAFLQKNQTSVEQISSIAGTREARKDTEQWTGFGPLKWATGNRSVRKVEEFVVHPNVVRSLGVGECVVVKKYPKASASRVRIHAPEVSSHKRSKAQVAPVGCERLGSSFTESLSPVAHLDAESTS